MGIIVNLIKNEPDFKNPNLNDECILDENKLTYIKVVQNC